jgi:hypothetical protein
MRPSKALRFFALAVLCSAFALFLLTGLTQGLAERRLTRALFALPNHDFTADILRMKNAGRVSEALDWACYVTNNPALPNQAAASNLVVLLAREQASVWRRADLAAKGFVTGSGASVEEMGGAIASDLLVYGDCRDLILQGYYRLTGHETDAVVAALAGVGLLTELVDAVDWAPALLKALRKANAMSRRFGDWLADVCRRSAKLRRLDPALNRLFSDLKRLHGRLGLARTATVFRHADDAADVALLAKHADAHPSEVYRLLATAGDDGLPLLRRYADAPHGIALVALATRKGARGLDALRRGGDLRHVTLFVRYGERVLRSLRLQRPQRFLHALAMRSPAARTALWAASLLLLSLSLWSFVVFVRSLLPHAPATTPGPPGEALAVSAPEATTTTNPD